MGYIKKLKSNELVGGTDKHTIYPVTSTEAVFEEITNGNESSFKSQKTINKEQQDELDDHEERIQAAEAEDIKSITINGSTKKFEVDSTNNVDLTIYTVDNDPEMPSIASNVEDLRNMVGTSTPVLETSHKTRIETLEGGESVTGSVENKIKTKVDSINSSYQDDNNEYVKYSMTQTSGEVTNFNIDETSLKNAITSLNTSISGDNIVIRQGSTPSGTGEAGKIYRYVNSSNNTYTDYMYSGGSWVTLATHDTSNEQAQVAYYTCTATGSGAQATKQFVSNGSLEYTPSSGGHIKILMGEANTATGTIYLKFGTTSATDSTKKPLYYNGEPASANNTWEAGETIAVYYDPSANNNAGAYFASNAQGGGGKAEKIKYDSSQSGLAATDVQEALDEVEDGLTTAQAVDLSTLTSVAFALWSNKWHSTKNGVFVEAMSVSPGQIFRVVADSILKADLYYFAYPETPANNKAASYQRILINAGETQYITIPDGVYYMVIQDDSVQTGGTTKLPQSIELITKQVVSVHTSEIESIQESMTTVVSKYTQADCINSGILCIDGTINSSSTSLKKYKTSNFIEIPEDAIAVDYHNVYYNNAYTYCGIVVCDSEYNVIWMDTRSVGALSGRILLKDKPNASYIRFMGDLNSTPSIEFIKLIEDLSAVDGSDIVNKYGTSIFSSTGTNYHSSLNYCSLDTPCVEDGIVQSVRGRFQNSGNITIYIGFFDQNDLLIVRDKFVIAVTSGDCEVDVLSRHIAIEENEYLFYCPHDKSSAYPTYGVDTSMRPVGIVVNNNLEYRKLTDGVYWSFGWSIKTHKASLAEMQEELNNQKNEINANSARISALEGKKKYYIDDELNGMTYLLTSRNGTLYLQPSIYHKVAILGNSLVKHGIKEDLWWGEWGMAATKREYDLVHIIEEGLRVKDNDVQCVCKNISAWETNFDTNKVNLLSDVLSNDTELVILRLGENVPAARVSEFYDEYCELIDYIYSVCPAAKIVMTGVFWVVPNKEEIIASVANDKHIDYVKINQWYSTCQETVGHYVYNEDYTSIHAITNTAAAQHPSNVGMANIANAILTNLGYESVNKTYSLQEVTVGGVTGTMWVLNE